MRIKKIQLSWFRGAADLVSLEPGCKSMVVYGENGSGKSSFVDAVEYVLNDGKIGHLAHEYSGRHQEKAVPNTHKPQGQKTELKIDFRDGSEFRVEIKQNGTSESSGAETVAMDTWDYQRTVLRQDEVAAFIHNTKGKKYSALLPLLGLHQLEIVAENLRRLAKSVEQQSELTETRTVIKGIETKRKEILGTDSEEEILKKIEDLHRKYCPENTGNKDVLFRCGELETAIATRLQRFSVDQKRHFVLQAIAELDLRKHADAVRTENAKLAFAAEPLITEKLEVLQWAEVFVDKLEDEEEVACPACGRVIPVDAFQSHIEAERERLRQIRGVFERKKAAIGTLCDTVKSLKTNLGAASAKTWREDLAEGTLAESIAHLEQIDAELLRSSCGEEDLKEIETKLLPLIDAAVSSSKDAPPDVQQLSADKQTSETGKAVIEAKDQSAAAVRAEALISFTESLEQGVREEIRLRSQTVIDEISTDVQAMWEILHPGEAIENVCLNLPKDNDKAIDIGLKFHGVEQDSPRLTLSEGYRNSLGLCIFLGMAKREAEKDRPLFLDDVVVSLDRNHRGMIVELLEKEFARRQVILLTHDREWNTELRQRLDGGNWTFKALMPYEKPEMGIRWSAKTLTFDDARALLEDTPDSAGNTARKIMDIELAMRAERVKVRMPYLYRERNDHRTAHDFLHRLISDGKKCFQKMGAKEYEPYGEAIEAFHDTDKLLRSWGNRASHSFDVVRVEAEKLIEACERGLGFFDCVGCKKPVYKLVDESAEIVQCQCGNLRWRYGKT